MNLVRLSLIALLTLGSAVVAVAEDRVYLQRSVESRAPEVYVGQINDYTGETLTMTTLSGRQIEIPAAKVAKVESDWSEQMRQAQALFAQKKFAEAEIAFQEAYRAEMRPWVKRLLIAETARCRRNLGRNDAAGDAFLALVASDPYTPYLDAMPLAWKTGEPDVNLHRAAIGWLERSDSPYAQLMGASFLLSAAERTQAIAVLQRLKTSAPAELAILADMQLWRTEPPVKDADKVAARRKQLERLPSNVQSGPRLLLGDALARDDQHEQATIEYLRIPILDNVDRPLAAEALLRAGKQLETMGRPAQAKRLYREIITDYPAAGAIGREASARMEKAGDEAP
ncbi:tetratricopeptide repeat protein [Blastopirellula sp. JC732]|uniref:Tetratricopeptide repeat protein n=1 Tax=Blastopirellula sediminis TaxID=2894196 RepID=A0A9X1SGJ9_9BACT|nr:tetratricopeptide repeat protein [Blastopirellula sediminis]MCC9607249.1 tetratricopeptide repeat protein [Blastopirellula sediminis]MCC9629458.1 tetratricopeptide repeat protein [Blastopirellula sediminis]